MTSRRVLVAMGKLQSSSSCSKQGCLTGLIERKQGSLEDSAQPMAYAHWQSAQDSVVQVENTHVLLQQLGMQTKRFQNCSSSSITHAVGWNNATEKAVQHAGRKATPAPRMS